MTFSFRKTHNVELLKRRFVNEAENNKNRQKSLKGKRRQNTWKRLKK